MNHNDRHLCMNQTLHRSTPDYVQFRRQEQFLRDLAYGGYNAILPPRRLESSVAVAFVYTERTDVVHAKLDCYNVKGKKAAIGLAPYRIAQHFHWCERCKNTGQYDNRLFLSQE